MSKEKDYFGFSKNVNDYYNHYVGIADAKAAAVIAISFLLFDFIIGLNKTTCIEEIFFYLTSFSLIFSCLFSLIAVYPRSPKEKKGLIFWENVRNFKNKDEYFAEIEKLEKKDIEEKYASQNYNLSNLLHRKHFYIRLAISSFIIALVFLTILYILIDA
ncbi:MAG: Pycsar system effector family protein [Aquaticitalea sp.]